MTKTTQDSTTFKIDSWLKQAVLMTLHAAVLTVPLFFMFSTNELFEFNKMMLVYLYTIIGAIAFGIRVVIHGSKLVKPTYLDIPIFIFIISQLLSTLFSMHPYTSLVGYYSRFHGGLLSTVSYTLLYYIAAHSLNRESLKQLWLSSAVAAGMVAIYGILERFGMSLSCLLVEGRLGVDCWVQDVQSRVFASFGQPNWLAAYAILLMPIYTSLAIVSQTQWRKKLYASVAVLLVLALFFTQSRSGILGWYGSIVVAATLGGWFFWTQHVKDSVQLSKIWSVFNRNMLYCIVGVCALLLVLVDAPYTPGLRSGESQSTQQPIQSEMAAAPEETTVVNRLEQGGTDSGEIRKIVWSGALDVWRRYPWLGSGVETFGYSYYLDRPIEHNLVSEWDFLYNKAHNEFLNFLATTGLVGLVSYLLLLGAFGWAILAHIHQQTKRTPSQTSVADAMLMVGLASGVTALMISNFFGFSTVTVSLLLYIFFAVPHILTSSEKTALTYTKIKALQWAGFVVISSIGLLLLNATFRHWSADIEYVQAKTYLDAGDLQQGLEKLESAIAKNPSEASYVDTLADRYSQYAVAFAQAGEATQSALFTKTAIQASDLVMLLNPEQMNFHKTRARLFITLGQIDPDYLKQAVVVLQDARKRAPTDAKLLYNIGVVELALENHEAGIAALNQAIEFKPNYQTARWHLAIAFEEAGELEAALEQLQYIQDNIAPNDSQILDKIASISAQLPDTQ
ncbi:MAG: O-antigen ligase family protein [Patescibacteria group bacterium]